MTKEIKINIGRGKSCDMIVAHPMVSRHHLDIIRNFGSEGYHYTIYDCSANGTIVNGKKFNNQRSSSLFVLCTRDMKLQFPSIILAGVFEIPWEKIEIIFTRKEKECFLRNSHKRIDRIL